MESGQHAIRCQPKNGARDPSDVIRCRAVEIVIPRLQKRGIRIGAVGSVEGNQRYQAAARRELEGGAEPPGSDAVGGPTPCRRAVQIPISTLNHAIGSRPVRAVESG